MLFVKFENSHFTGINSPKTLRVQLSNFINFCNYENLKKSTYKMKINVE